MNLKFRRLISKMLLKMFEKVEARETADANRESERLAQDAALDFLDELNRFSDRIRKNYSDFPSLRKSDELETFLLDLQ